MISESVRGEGALLLNHKGNRFINELKPRDIVSNAIFKEMEMENSEYEYLNMQSIDLDIEERFPNICKYLKDININPKKENVPIVPAQHYTMGGIKVDLNCRTTMKDLYAVGEVACTGVHGKNRLASNSLLESVVFGVRAAKNIAKNIDMNLEIKNGIKPKKYEKLMDLQKISSLIKERICEDEFKKATEFSN